MQIDYIIALGEVNKYETLKQRIEGVINQYANIDTEADIDKIFEKIAIYSSNVGKENQKRTLDKGNK